MSEITKIIPEISFKEVVEYITYIEDKYSDIIKNIENKPIDAKIKAIAIKFARAQDSMYDKSYKTDKYNGGHLGDDIFEIMIGNKYFSKIGNKYNNEEFNELMHDAWTFGKMFIVKDDFIMIRRSNDNGFEMKAADIESQDYIIDENTFKTCKAVTVDDIRPVTIRVNKKEYTFLWKRIFKDLQVRNYNNLANHQKTLDIPSHCAYFSVMSIEDIIYINEYYGIRPPQSFMAENFGGKRSKIIDSGKRIILSGTNAKRIMYIGNGLKYIKTNGKYVQLQSKFKYVQK